MTNVSLAHSYVVKATKRLKALKVLFDEEAYSDVIREAQEIVELALKGMLRQIGVEPPKQHDVGQLIIEFKDKWPPGTAEETGRLAKISKWLRKEREFSFYGDVDFIPTLEYTREDADRALKDAVFVVSVAQRVIPLE
ncbi:DNA-binding protein [Clostridiales bacterium PH28_bin88]|nr:DNA-binding protein [Clostridiales bacterium PH28_bin88]